ncbi:hypothetical protein HDU98_009032 [Podochytrium sp. JEL0797]|nr:hypothetical protein HDU98_009032 [Podochytrium sp. JEL0797]
MSSAIRLAVFSGLSLLGFDETLSAPVETLFAKGSASANPKAFEAVAHFLLCEAGCGCVDKEAFRGCWPVADRGAARDFRTIVVKQLDLLKKCGALPNTLQIRRSFFDDARGDRFEHAILALTTHVISCTMNNEYKECISPLPDHLSNAASPTPSTLQDLQSAIQDLSAKFHHDTSHRDAETKEWIEYGTFLSNEFRTRLVEIEKLTEIRNEMQANPIFVDGVGVGEFEALKQVHAEKLDSVRELWRDCLAWIETNQENNKIITSVMNQRANIHSIDASTARLEIPNELSEQFRKEIQAERINPYAEGGMLDMVSVVKLWGISVKTVDESLRNAVLPPNEDLLAESLESINHKVDLLKGVEASSKAIRKQLLQRQEELMESVQELKLERSMRLEEEVEATPKPKPTAVGQNPYFRATSASFSKNAMTLAPTTPKLHLRDRMAKAGPASHFKYPTLPMGHATAATPDAVSQIRANVRSKLVKEDAAGSGGSGKTKPSIYTPKTAMLPESPAMLYGSTPVKRGLAAAAPDSCLRVKPSMGHPPSSSAGIPVRKKMSASALPQKAAKTSSTERTPMKRGSVSTERKGVASRVDTVVDQIVHSIATGGGGQIQDSPGSARKTVRFNETTPKERFSTLGFQPRAEITRTPIKTPSTSTKKPTSTYSTTTTTTTTTPRSKLSNAFTSPAASKTLLPNARTPSLVKSVLKSNLRGAAAAGGTPAAKPTPHAPSPYGRVSSPSRIATSSPSRRAGASGTPATSSREGTPLPMPFGSTKKAVKTRGNAEVEMESLFAGITVREGEEEVKQQEPTDWLKSTLGGNVEALDDLLDEDAPDFMADTSIMFFPSASTTQQPTTNRSSIADPFFLPSSSANTSLLSPTEFDEFLASSQPATPLAATSAARHGRFDEFLPRSEPISGQPSFLDDFALLTDAANPMDEMSFAVAGIPLVDQGEEEEVFVLEGGSGGGGEKEGEGLFGVGEESLNMAMRSSGAGAGFSASAFFKNLGKVGGGSGLDLEEEEEEEEEKGLDGNEPATGFFLESVCVGEIGGENNDDESILEELPPRSVEHSGDGADLFDGVVGLAGDGFDSGVVEEEEGVEEIGVPGRGGYEGVRLTEYSLSVDEVVSEREGENVKEVAAAPVCLSSVEEADALGAELEQLGLSEEHGKQDSVASASKSSNSLLADDIAVSNIMLSASLEETGTGFLDDFAVSNIQVSQEEMDPVVKVEGRGGLLMDSFVAWDASKEDPVAGLLLDDQEDSCGLEVDEEGLEDGTGLINLEDTSIYFSADNKHGILLGLEKDGSEEEEEEEIPDNLLDFAGLVPSAAVAPTPSSVPAISSQTLAPVASSPCTSSSEMTSSFDPFGDARSPRTATNRLHMHPHQQLRHPSVSSLRLDSGVAEGPEDMSEIPPGHPDPSHVLMSQDEPPSLDAAAVLEPLQEEEDASLFPAVAAAAEAESGEMRMDDIAGHNTSSPVRVVSEKERTRNPPPMSESIDSLKGRRSSGVMLESILDWNCDDSNADNAFGESREHAFIVERSLGWFGSDSQMQGVHEEPSFLTREEPVWMLEKEGDSDSEEETDL